MLIYHGSKLMVQDQLDCPHKWSDVCIDSVSRYYQCVECNALDRDIDDWEKYIDVLRDREEEKEKVWQIK